MSEPGVDDLVRLEYDVTMTARRLMREACQALWTRGPYDPYPDRVRRIAQALARALAELVQVTAQDEARRDMEPGEGPESFAIARH